jgi:hypothetical protein
MAFYDGGAIITGMKLALAAKLTIDPKRLLSSRWVHDTAHALVTSVRKAKDAIRMPRPRRA